MSDRNGEKMVHQSSGERAADSPLRASARFEHTSGPWRVGAIASGRRAISARTWRELAKVVVYNPSIPDGEGEANARLIAAAPDLLDALRIVRERLPGLAVFSTDQETGETFDKLIDAAIAKATGAA